MVSLTYSASTGLLCGTLATNIIERLGEHRAEMQQPSSFRFHLATTLGGAILILATLLCRDLSSIGLQEHKAAYVKSFSTAVEMLKELAQVLRAGRRIADDLDTVVSSVQSILLRSSFSPPRDGADIQEGAFDNLFPYLNHDPNQLPETTFPPNGAETVGSTFNYDMFATLDTWDNYFHPDADDYGVPWI
jgi:hypothetical protein